MTYSNLDSRVSQTSSRTSAILERIERLRRLTRTARTMQEKIALARRLTAEPSTPTSLG